MSRDGRCLGSRPDPMTGVNNHVAGQLPIKIVVHLVWFTFGINKPEFVSRARWEDARRCEGRHGHTVNIGPN